MKDLNKYPIILASGSPRRKQLLEQIDLEFEVVPSQIYEDFSLNLSPTDFVEYYAQEKAKDVANSYPDKWVIGADTIVVLGSLILGNPKDGKDSFSRILVR